MFNIIIRLIASSFGRGDIFAIAAHYFLVTRFANGRKVLLLSSGYRLNIKIHNALTWACDNADFKCVREHQISLY